MQSPTLKLISVTHIVFEHHVSLRLIANLKIVCTYYLTDIDDFLQQNTSQTHGDHQNQKLCGYGLVKLITLEVTFDIDFPKISSILGEKHVISC